MPPDFFCNDVEFHKIKRTENEPIQIALHVRVTLVTRRCYARCTFVLHTLHVRVTVFKTAQNRINLLTLNKRFCNISSVILHQIKKKIYGIMHQIKKKIYGIKTTLQNNRFI